MSLGSGALVASLDAASLRLVDFDEVPGSSWCVAQLLVVTKLTISRKRGALLEQVGAVLLEHPESLYDSQSKRL